MPDRVILDSSVIAAVFFKEEASERAEKSAENCELLTVDVAVAEVANVAWKRITHFNESREITLKALKTCVDFIADVCEVLTSQSLYECSFGIAVEDNITVYDALFIAASEREKVPFLTLDKELYENLYEKRDIQLV